MQIFAHLNRIFSWTKRTRRGLTSLYTFSRSIQSDTTFQYDLRAANKNDVGQIWHLLQSQVPSWPSDPYLINTVIELFPGAITVGEDTRTKRIVGMCSVVPVNDTITVAGLYLVHKDVRGRGLGQQMSRHIINNNGERNIVIESVAQMIHVYERMGLQKWCTSTYWNGKIRHETLHRYDGCREIEVQEVKKLSVSEIIKYDRNIYPTCRDWFFKQCLFKQPSAHVRTAVENKQVVGYGFTRQLPGKFYLNSLYANDADIARLILSSAIFDVPVGAELTVSVPDDNKQASSLAREIGLKPVEQFTKMYTEKPLQLASNRIFFATPTDILLL